MAKPPRPSCAVRGTWHIAPGTQIAVRRVDQPITTGLWVDGLRGQLVPFDSRVLTTGATWRRTMEIILMKRALLKQCRDTLIQVRTLKHDELDPGVTAELDAVIAKMTLLLETAGDDVETDRVLIERALAVIGRVAVGLDWLRRITREFLE